MGKFKENQIESDKLELFQPSFVGLIELICRREVHSGDIEDQLESQKNETCENQLTFNVG